MEVLKEKYLTLSIHRQIQVGVIGVTCCVCSLVFLILFINMFFLLTLYYHDCLSFFENRDNEKILNVSYYVDSTFTIAIEKNRLSTQVIRNFIQNYKNNLHFVNVLNNNNFTKYLKKVTQYNIPVCEDGNGNCIFYKFLDQDYSNDSNFQSHLKMISLTIPIMKSMFNYRIYNFQKIPFFLNFKIISKVFNTIFYYGPNSEINEKFNMDDLRKYLIYQSELIAYLYEYEIKTLNLIKNNSTISIIAKNPFIYQTSILNNITQINKGAFNEADSVTSINSFLYNKYSETKTLLENLSNVDNIIDSISGDFSNNLLDSFAIYGMKIFKDINYLVENLGGKLSSPSSCHYLIKLNQIFNDDLSYNREEFKSDILYPLDCFQNSTRFNLINLTSQYSQDLLMKHRFRFKFTTDLHGNDFYFKLLAFKNPLMNTILNFDSPLLNVFSLRVYVLKNQKIFENKINLIYFLFLGNMLFVLLFNLVIWFFLIFIISIILIRVSNSISQPITELVKQVTEVEMNTNPKKTNLIDFPDDDFINDFFQICKSLIRGGFNENQNDNLNKISERKSKVRAVNQAYNNVSVIKTNNLIIEEDKIEDDFIENGNFIFNYEIQNIINENELPIITAEFNKIEDDSSIYNSNKSEIKIDKHNKINYHKYNSIISNLDKIDDDLNLIHETEILNLIKEEEESDSIFKKSCLYNIMIENRKQGLVIELITI